MKDPWRRFPILGKTADDAGQTSIWERFPAECFADSKIVAVSGWQWAAGGAERRKSREAGFAGGLLAVSSGQWACTIGPAASLAAGASPGQALPPSSMGLEAPGPL